MNQLELQQIKERELAARKQIVLRCCLAAGCTSSASKDVKERLERAVAEAGLQNEVEVRGVGCMKLCCAGPLVQVDPAATLYANVTAETAPSIIAALKGGTAKPEQVDPHAPFFTLQQSGKALIFDARPAFFYNLGHIPGAINLAKNRCDEAIHAQETAIKAAVDAGQTIVVYCSSSSCPDARTVAIHISGFGYPAKIFYGGMDEWREASMPTE